MRYLGHIEKDLFNYEEKVAGELNAEFLGRREFQILEIAKQLAAMKSQSNSPEIKIKRQKLLASLTDLLLVYKPFWNAVEDDESDRGWRIDELPSQLLSLDPEDWRARTRALQAFWFVQDVLRLANEGHLELIRQCDVCKRWMVARQDNQRLCSKKCRQKDYESREEVKERRNQARRDRYRAERDRDTENRKTFEQNLKTSFRKSKIARTTKGEK